LLRQASIFVHFKTTGDSNKRSIDSNEVAGFKMHIKHRSTGNKQFKWTREFRKVRRRVPKSIGSL